MNQVVAHMYVLYFTTDSPLLFALKSLNDFKKIPAVGWLLLAESCVANTSVVSCLASDKT